MDYVTQIYSEKCYLVLGPILGYYRMKSFKEFKNIPKQLAIFCNAGGRDGQYNHINFPTDNKKEFVAFSNAGGKDGQYDSWSKVEENLNPKFGPEFIRTRENIFIDPLRNNHQLGYENNSSKKLSSFIY